MKRLTLLLVVCAVLPALTRADDQSRLAAIRQACSNDAQKLCAGVQPGGGRIVACLKEHKDSLSDGCRQAAGLTANSGNSAAPATSPAGGNADSDAAAPAPANSPSKSASATASKTRTFAGCKPSAIPALAGRWN